MSWKLVTKGREETVGEASFELGSGTLIKKAYTKPTCYCVLPKPKSWFRGGEVELDNGDVFYCKECGAVYEWHTPYSLSDYD